MGFRARFTTFLCVLLAAAPTAHGQNGYLYTIRVTGGSPGGPPGITGGAGTISYVGRAQFIGSRGRVDIVDGGLEPLFAKGDYLIVDSTTITVVHPARQEYIVIGGDSAGATNRLAAMGVTMTLSDERVKLDTLGAGDTISGVPTRRFRMSIAFNMAMDAGMMQQRLGSETVTDYWVGNVPGLPSNPLLRSNSLGGSGMGAAFRTLSARVDSAATRMGSSLALRTSATTRVILGPGRVIETQQSSQVTDLKRAGIDQSLLMIPAGFKKVALPN